MDFSNLNEKQKEAVQITEGPLLVFAGAGSGKTKVLTTRIAYLVQEIGINPKNILAITFTNKAAKEMRERIFKILGDSANNIWISTFHSFGLLIIKENYSLLNLKSNFTIIDADDSLNLIKKIMKDNDIDPKDYNPKAIKNRISSAKSELIDYNSYEKYASTDFEKIVHLVYRHYDNRLSVSNSLDFDDLLVKPIMLFQKNPDKLLEYQERFKYILVDEYQDTNQAQYILTKLIANKYKNICVVGDNDQAIYSWRQADYRNILNFEKDYPKCKTILLEQNYRSTSNILGAANSVIKNNKERRDKILWTSQDDGEKLTYHTASDEKEEASYVVKEIDKLLKNGVHRDQIAVLYRTNALSRNVEEALLIRSIPFKVIGSYYFYNRREIKDLIAYLKLIYNPDDDISLLRVINTPKRGIGEVKQLELTKQATFEKTSIFNIIKEGKEKEFKNIILNLKKEQDNLSLTKFIELVLDKSGLKSALQKEDSIESLSKLENLEEFKSVAKNFEEKEGLVSLEDFLEHITLVADITENKEENDVITLMTIHASKGLEFDYVFIIGLEENLFPHKNSMETPSELEEERRLCYVAITRAKIKVYLLNTSNRLYFGESTKTRASRFINEIDEKYLDRQKTEKIFHKESNINPNEEYSLGMKVTHDIFGMGIVVSLTTDTVSIAFSNKYGVKNLMKGHKSIKKL